MRIISFVVLSCFLAVVLFILGCLVIVGVARGSEGEVIFLDNLDEITISTRDSPSAPSAYFQELYGSYAHETFKKQPNWLRAVQKAKSDFRTKDMSTSFPSRFLILEDGSELVVLRGCTPHDCYGTEHVVVYSLKLKKAYVLKENRNKASVIVYGSPNKVIKDVLLKTYLDH